MADEALLADGFFRRLKGLLGTPSLAKGKGIYIVPCRQIHMFGMKYAIDCVFLDKAGTVVGIVQSIGPGALSPIFAKAHGCLELPAGTIADTGTAEGDKIESGPPPFQDAPGADLI